MTTNLVVADASRTEKTICLAVSPSLKAYGIPGRARLFEVVQKVKEANLKRQRNAPGYRFTGASSSSVELANNPGLAIDYPVSYTHLDVYKRQAQLGEHLLCKQGVRSSSLLISTNLGS